MKKRRKNPLIDLELSRKGGKEAREKAQRRADEQAVPIGIVDSRGRITWFQPRRQKNPVPTGKFIPAKAVRIRKVGRRTIVDIRQ